MKVSRPRLEGGLLLCFFLLCVKNVHAKAQISFGEDPTPPKKTEENPVPENPEIGTRTGVNSQRQGGLLADILGVDPLGRPQSGNIGNNGNSNNFGNNGNNNNFDDGPEERFTSSCCCTPNNFCPSTNGQLGNGDEDGFSGLKPGLSSDPKDNKDSLDELKANIGVRIVNDAPDTPIGGCPSGTKECCYPSNININSFGSQCFPTGGNQNQFVPWDQGCLQRVPRNGGKQCGQRFFTPLQNLEKGQASPEEFPWICMMLTDSDRFLGSCAIIPEDSDNDISRGTYRVITAAHKLSSLEQNEQLKIRIIEYDGSGYNPQKERVPHEDFEVSRFIVHPNFNSKRLSDDIAVIILDRPINLVSKQGVNAACLPACGNMFEYQFSNGTGVRCWVAGWGRTCEDCNFSFIQRKVDVPIFNRRNCENVMKGELSSRFRLRAGEVCAGGEAGKDACDGDGGSPLVCQSEEGNWHVVGLVAWGVGCAEHATPGIYVNVYQYEDFITNLAHRRRVESRKPTNVGVRSGGD